MSKMRKVLPMQPVVWDGRGVIRFQENPIVRYLLAEASAKGLDLNFLHRQSITQGWKKADWEQFAQLIGYSLSGFSELSYVRNQTYSKACRRRDALLKLYPEDPSKRREQPSSDEVAEKAVKR